MASIVSSQIAFNNKQVDGRSIIHEEHVDDSGNVYSVDYMADPKTDIDAHLAASAAQLNGNFKYLIDNAVPIAQAAVDAARKQITTDQDNLTQAQAILAAAQVVLVSPLVQPNLMVANGIL